MQIDFTWTKRWVVFALDFTLWIEKTGKRNWNRNNFDKFFVFKIDFFYTAPELQSNNNGDDMDDYNDKVEGSTDIDWKALSTRIELPHSIGSLDIVLANDLFIQTPNIERAIKTLKHLICPRKNVQFAPEVLDSSPQSSSSSSSPTQPKAKSQRPHQPFEPYAANVRRSNRIARRRNTHVAWLSSTIEIMIFMTHTQYTYTDTCASYT